jgi:serralysin
VPGSSSALESLETSFHQDLNGDGAIGLYAPASTVLQINSALAGAAGAATIGTGATLELTAADSASVTFSSATGMLKLDHSSTFSAEIFNFTGNGSLSGSDQIDLKDISFNSVHDSYASGVLTVTDGTNTTELNFNGSYVLANFKFASDGSGGTIVYDPPVPTSNPAAPTAASGTLSGDNFEFNSHVGHATNTNVAPSADTIPHDHTGSSSTAAVLASHADAVANAVIADALHDTVTHQHVMAAQLPAHQSDFHF